MSRFINAKSKSDSDNGSHDDFDDDFDDSDNSDKQVLYFNSLIITIQID